MYIIYINDQKHTSKKININKLKKMKKKEKHLSLGAALLILCAVSAGLGMTTSCINKNSEYASETNKKFYKRMTKMDKNEVITFHGFPACLTSIFNITAGDEILAVGEDTLYLVYRGLNYNDVNRYHFYIIKDNHDNLWSIFRHNEKFLLYREDEVAHSDWLQIKGK